MRFLPFLIRYPRESGRVAVFSGGGIWVLVFAGMTIFVMALVITLPTAAQEQSSAPYAYRQLDDPAQEKMAQTLMESLRCLQCQGQSIADSDAPIAGSMRSLVRERITAGEDPEAIRAWLIERYGDYVSYAPRLTSLTWPLFVVPLLLIGLAVLLLRRRFGKGGGQ